MLTRRRVLPVIVLFGLALTLALRDAARWSSSDARFDGPAARRVFDPSRAAAADLHAAETQALAQGKRILMDVGGNWCPWCLLLDYTIQHDAPLRTQEAETFVVLHVNWSAENCNRAVLSQYPAAGGYPAWYVLAADGHLLQQKSPTDFQNSRDLAGAYNRAALATFFASYKPREQPQDERNITGSPASAAATPATGPRTRRPQ